MGIAYFRPKTLEDALNLLRLPNKVPLAGGTYLTSNKSNTNDLVDLQDLDLNVLAKKEHGIEIGAMVRLQQLLDSTIFPDAFQNAVKLEIPINLRNSASMAGLIIKCDGRSPIATSLLAMDSSIILEPGHESVSLSDFLTSRRYKLHNHLITSIKLQSINFFSFQYVARTKFDRPIVCVALSKFLNGGTWLAIGGFGDHPILLCKEDNLNSLPLTARNAVCSADDEWASSDYRSAIVEILTERCLAQLPSSTET